MHATHPSVTAAPPNARATLRHATGAIHDSVHDLPLMRRLADGALTRPDYFDLTSRLLAYYIVVDAQMIAACARLAVPPTLYDYAPRAPLLHDDLDALAPPAPPRAAPATPRVDSAADLATLPELAGAAYVVEGSLLGAKLLDRALPPETVDAGARRFWTWCASAGPQRWAMTRTFIETACPAPADRAAAIDAAVTVFALFRDVVSQHRATSPD